MIETNDCTVRALRDAFGCSYETAYKVCERFGRRSNEGFHIQAELLERLGLKIQAHYQEVKVRDMLGRINKTKVYLCLVPGHIFTIRDGSPVEASDHFENWLKKFGREKVRRLFEVPSAKVER